jgi:hypothetical protein
VEELLRLGELADQCIGRIALARPSEGGRTNTGLAIHSGRPGSDKCVGEGGVGTHCMEGPTAWMDPLRRRGQQARPGCGGLDSRARR